MATRDWKKVKGKLIWRDEELNTVSIFSSEGVNIVNIEGSSGNFVKGKDFKTKTEALSFARRYMRIN